MCILILFSCHLQMLHCFRQTRLSRLSIIFTRDKRRGTRKPDWFWLVLFGSRPTAVWPLPRNRSPLGKPWNGPT